MISKAHSSRYVLPLISAIRCFVSNMSPKIGPARLQEHDTQLRFIPFAASWPRGPEAAFGLPDLKVSGIELAVIRPHETCVQRCND
jgi:hypothetical protein